MADQSHDNNVVYLETAGNPGKDAYINTMFGGGRGGGPMDPTVPLKDYVDKADEALESRLSAQLEKLPTKGTVWGAAGTALGVILAVLAFGGDRFEGGMSVSPTIAAAQANQKKTDDLQNTKMQAMNEKLDLIIKQTSK